MKKLALLLAAFALLAAHGALAATYVFPYEGFRYAQGDGETVLTQTNLDQHEAFIESLGTTKDAILASYLASGIVMEVIPSDGGQIAVSVVDAGAFSDVDDMSALDDERLTAFVSQFEESGLYETCALTDTDPVCVRLTSSALYGSMPVYAVRYAMLHLGRLYMLTETVVGRAPQAEDDARLNAVLSRMELLGVLVEPTPAPTPAPTPTPEPSPVPTPGVAVTIQQTGELTVEGVPSYTNAAQLSLTGVAPPSQTVQVFIGDRRLGETTAGDDGAYAIDVTLPEPGDLTLTVSAGEDVRALALRYELPRAALTITEPENPVFTGNSVFVRGTTEPEATVYITGKGTNTNVRANRAGAFSVRIFMYDAGTEVFTFSVRPRGFQEATAEVTLTRELTEREGLAQFRQEMIEPNYDDLASNAANYAGRKFVYRAKVAEFADYDGRPCALVLTNNVSTGVWRDPVWVVLTGDEGIAVDDVITFYLECEGTSLLADGQYTASGQSAPAPVTRAVYTTANR